jgi:hypothetical protein
MSHESFLLTPGFFPENEKISTPPPCGFLIGIYIFYESWSTETFRNRDLKRWAVCYLRRVGAWIFHKKFGPYSGKSV